MQTARITPTLANSDWSQLAAAYDGETLVVRSYGPADAGFVDMSFYTRSTAQWNLQQRVKVASDGVLDPRPAIAGSIAVLGLPQEAVAGRTGQGIVRTFVRVGGTWTQAPVLQALDGARFDNFGARVALFGNTLAVGAPGDDATTQGDPQLETGSIYLYAWDGAAWQIQAKISHPAPGSGFGKQFALGADVLASSVAEGVYMYARSGGTWSPLPTLRISPNGMAEPPINTLAIVGSTLALDIGQTSNTILFENVGGTWTRGVNVMVSLRSGDGAHVEQGAGYAFASNTFLNGVALSGSVRSALYVYRKEGIDWFYRQRIAPPAGSNDFGRAPIIVGDTVIVPDATYSADGQGSPPRGAVFVYDSLPIGDNVLLGDSIRAASGGSGDAAGDAITFANGLLVIGAPEGGTNGEVYVFQFSPGAAIASGRSFAKSAQLLAVLRNNGGGIGDKFGAAVAVGDDGSTIAIGSPLASSGTGAAYVFRKPAGGWGNDDVPDESLLPPAPTPQVTPGGFGSAVGFNKNGVIVVGAPLSDRNGVTDAGIAVTFVPTAGDYSSTPTQTLMPSVAEAGATFGDEVATAGDIISVSASNQDRVGPLPDAGAVHTYEAPSGTTTYQPGPMLSAPNGTIGDKFGRGLATDDMGGNGPTIVVGAPGIDAGSDQDTGRALVFENPGTGYVPVARLLTGGRPFDRAGTSISITEELVVIGAPEADRDDQIDSGSAYLFRKPAGGWLGASAALAKRQGKVGYAVIDVMPQTELEPAEVQKDQFFGAALAVEPAAAFVSAPARDVQLANGAVSTDQGEIDVFVFDVIFDAGFE